MNIVPKNWRDFQHYKDRNPPWIRLHKSLLDNYDFQCLPVASRALAPMLWLLASDCIDGQIDADPKRLAFRLRTTEREVAEALKPLIDNGFFVVDHSASKAIAECLQDAVPETEAETSQRQRTEAEKKPRKPRHEPDGCLSVDAIVSEGVDPQVAKDWFQIRKDKGAKTLTQTAWDRIKAEAVKAEMSVPDVIREAAERGWQSFRASWMDKPMLSARPQQASKHTGFDSKDYNAGANEDGTIV